MNKITQKEIKELVELLGKLSNPEKGLPGEVFNALTRIVPFSACELVVVNTKKEILLTYREDRWWKGWHIPGGLLRMNEDFKTRLGKVAKNELGAKLKSFKFLFPINYKKTPRGHDVSLVFLCILTGKLQHGTFFKNLPKNTIKEHNILYKKLRELKLV